MARGTNCSWPNGRRARTWAIPGSSSLQLISGGLEPDETAWQGALREMREETGLLPGEFYRLSTLTSFYRPDNDSLNIAPMFCAIVNEDAKVTINAEHSAFEWVDVEEARSRLMWPSDRQALAELRSVVLGGGIAREHMRIMTGDGA
jgi:dihydroneopterin triphosphate diphosphatase